MKDISYYDGTDLINPSERDFKITILLDSNLHVEMKKPFHTLTPRDKQDYYVLIEKGWEEKYHKARCDYNDTINQRKKEFKLDLFEANGVKDNPKAEKLFKTICFEIIGDEDDFYDIQVMFETLVEFIK